MTQNWHTEQIKEFDAEYTGAMSGMFDLRYEAKRIIGDPAAGDIFIYLFRRFGYPRVGWDDLKDIVKYVLTTPKEGVLLVVIPTVAGGYTFGYLLREDLDDACEEEERVPMNNWNTQFDKWVLEEHGIETIRTFEQDNDKLNRVWKKWAEDKQRVDFGSERDTCDCFFADQGEIRTKYAHEYNMIVPYPACPRIEDRDSSSVVKQCHIALCGAISDLLSPVYVRDVLINICGRTTPPDDSNVVAYYTNAGYGVGDKMDVCE